MEERDVMEVDVLFVGGGVASLSGALHLSNLVRKHNEKVEQSGGGTRLEEISVAVLEKGAYVGAHSISGAVMDPVALKELVPDYRDRQAPLEGEVTKEEVSYLTGDRRIRMPVIPPPLNNRGNVVVSLARLTEWLGRLVEEGGVDVFPGFPCTEVLYDGARVIGVRTGDKGVGSDGAPKPNHEPGIDLHAKLTVFGEGARGSLAKTLSRKFSLGEGRNPQGYEVGVKEVWELPEGSGIRPGDVYHTVGHPLKSDTFGGGFIYGMRNNTVAVGLLNSLGYRDPFLDPHRMFQKFKTHPFVAEILKGGKPVQFGAKSVPVSGYFSIPRLYFEGGVLIGDSAGLFNGMKLKGIHYAMKSGMLAAETILQALLAQDFSARRLAGYEKAVRDSYIGKELYRVRNFRQSFEQGFWRGLARVGIQYVLGGRDWSPRLEAEPDYARMKSVVDYYGGDSPSDGQKGTIRYDGTLTFDKETDVYHSGSTHEENQPSHLRVPDLNICYTECREQYRNPCVNFCPAGVYEMETDEKTGLLNLKLNFSNCVHCKTCDIKDPFENITWVPPEGGGGPRYTLV